MCRDVRGLIEVRCFGKVEVQVCRDVRGLIGLSDYDHHTSKVCRDVRGLIADDPSEILNGNCVP